ncbi:LysE family translocator [Pseudobacteroides cellulosolvens]|uniref:Lysine exporter protein (LYSE/YGGA) n=1 Tax=Pseudobacteroides cellulosolvens ATCC 35603 = DSM 2933 TaxID=398512 RepID=A0A0L6JR09_9FIRM|nr:LysE family transporter [Pseudobacteroides cellulosolvens]KNY28271.1 Lysine exporter protein (LYSE/YGGA) [Pseudobacteroides cellulosolvens ATCC 35603 = DSM 2933]
MVLKGFRFGLMLQFAIGPVCIYIFNTATNGGFLPAEAAVLAATLMDTIFVTLAILGIGSLLEKDGVKKALKYFGTVILIYFGLGTILGTFGIKIIPTIAGNSNLYDTSNAFVTSFILTASSPLSILFWSGVFATKLSSEGFSKKEMRFFGVGAVMATLVFLTIFAVIVSLLHPMMNQTVVDVMNVLVGIIIIGFGLKMLLKKV